MKRQLFLFVLTFVITGFLFTALPVEVSAQLSDPAAGAEGNLVPCSGSDCTFCHVIELGNNILKWLFGIVFVIFGVIIFIAGFGLVTSGGNQTKLDDAKKKLSNALIGIIIVFCAFLIVDTLVRMVITNGELGTVSSNLTYWNEITCFGEQSVPNEVPDLPPGAGMLTRDDDGNICLPPPYTSECFPEEDIISNDGERICVRGESTGSMICAPDAPDCGTSVECYDIPGGSTLPGVTSVDEDEVEHDAAVARLESAGINLWSSGVVTAECPPTGGCTTLTGVKEQVIQQVLNIRSACPTCSITVTGAAEPGPHAAGEYSHANGYKVDIDDSPELDAYLISTLTRDGSRTGSHGGPRYRDACGNEYVKESTHWDITVNNGSCSL